MSARQKDGREAGFSLLEVIISFTILAIAISIAVQTISNGGLAFKRASDLESITLALAELRAGELQNVNWETAQTGRFDNGISWQIESQRIPDSRLAPIYAVTITITEAGDRGRTYRYNYIAAGSL